MQARTPALRWYVEGLRFECQRCGACRTGEPGYVWVTNEETRTIAQYLGICVDESAREYLRRPFSHDSLIELPDGRCVFYTGNLCQICAVRPSQCRTFPFWQTVVASPESWERCQKACPGVGKGKLFSAKEIEEILQTDMRENRRPKLYPR
jgi:Fe-S-cluster containining protein